MSGTLLCLALLASSGDNTKAIAFVQSMQTPSGAFVTTRQPGEDPKLSLRTTRTALRALRLLGGKPADRGEVIRFLHECYDADRGGFAARPELPPDPISTSVGLMILGELKLPNDEYVDAGMSFMDETTKDFEQIRMVASSLDELGRTVPNATKWLDLIDKARNPDGSFGSGPGVARSTALYVVAEMRLGREIDRSKILEILRAGQHEDGGFRNLAADRSDLESCYRVVRLFRRLDAQPDRVDDLRVFIKRCENEDGGFGRTPDEASSLHGTYYATIIRHWLDGGK